MRMKKVKTCCCIVLCLLLLAAFSACQKQSDGGSGTFDGKNPVATIEMEDGGIIKIELYPNVAPNTVNNFISLANQGFYDGLTFHRVIKGFMIQGGDPQGTGMGGPDYTIAGEFNSNGFQNALSHTRGVISMARKGQAVNGIPANDSAGSQFFIVHEDSTYLDGQYASFGKVTEGMDVVDQIAAVEVDGNSKPLKDVVMKKVTVDTFGTDFAEPVKYSK